MHGRLRCRVSVDEKTRPARIELQWHLEEVLAPSRHVNVLDHQRRESEPQVHRLSVAVVYRNILRNFVDF